VTETVTVYQNDTVVVVEVPEADVVEILEGGPQGPIGPSLIGGYGFSITNLQANDVLRFNGTLWANYAMATITVSATEPSSPSVNDVWIDTSA
jgi:hypothetical protein